MCPCVCGGQKSVCGNWFFASRREGAQVIRPKSKCLYGLTHTSIGIFDFCFFFGLGHCLTAESQAYHFKSFQEFSCCDDHKQEPLIHLVGSCTGAVVQRLYNKHNTNKCWHWARVLPSFSFQRLINTWPAAVLIRISADSYVIGHSSERWSPLGQRAGMYLLMYFLTTLLKAYLLHPSVAEKLTEV